MPDISRSTATVVCVDDTTRHGSGHDRPRDSLAAFGGRLLDGGAAVALVAFSSAADALEAAIVTQRRFTGPHALGMGIAAGDVLGGPNDRTSTAVFVARRLQRRAAPGQILAASAVLALVRGVLDVPCRSLVASGGEGFEVQWSWPSHPGAVLPSGLAIALELGERFVGRGNEWAVLDRAWSDVRAGGQRVVLVSGDAGAGKTRLAAEFALKVHREGGRVLYGACDRDLRSPYEPWVQALGGLDPVRRPERRAERHPTDRSRRVPFPPAGDSPRDAMLGTASPDGAEGSRLFESVVAILAATARTQPVIVVLDDVHWASSKTLALLRYFARAASCPHTLIVCVHREADAASDEAFVSCLSEMHRLSGVLRVRVGGLDQGSVEDLLAGVDGADRSEIPTLAAALTERSGGNAFFILELWRHLLLTSGSPHRGERAIARSDLAWSAVPEGVKEVLAPRLRGLTPSALSLLEVAALVGERFDLELVREATCIDGDQLVAGLDDLVASGLLSRPDAPGWARRDAYQFAHRLVRDAVEESVSPLARSRLHLHIAEAMERLSGAGNASSVAELARHYRAAAPFCGHVKAAQYERLAAAQAMRSAAYDEAIGHLQSVLAHAGAPTRERVELLLDLSVAQLRRGLALDSTGTCAEAFDLACVLGLPDLVARAALAFEEGTRVSGLRGGDAVDRLHHALSVVDHDEVALRARLHASLASGLAIVGRTAGAIAEIDHAFAMARHVGDDETLCHTLEAATIALTDPHRVIAVADELGVLSDRLHDDRRQSYAESSRFRAEVSVGRLDAAAVTLERYRRLSKRTVFPEGESVCSHFEVVLALAAGRFAEAEAAAERALAVAGRDTPLATGIYVLQMLALRREQGRPADALALLGPLLEPPAGSNWRFGRAVLHAELGMLDEARRELDTLALDDGAALAHDSMFAHGPMWPGVLSFIAETTLAVGDAERAGAVARALAVFHGCNLMVGPAVCLGPADRLLAGLSSLLGAPVEAEAHFRAAHDLARRSRSPVWRVRVEHDWARFLAAHHEAARAFEMGTRAARDAEALGMHGIARAPLPLAAIRAKGRSALSARELDVLRLVAAGCSNREIGRRLYISANTAANHVRAILQKTGCTNRAQAVAFAASRHLLDEQV